MELTVLTRQQLFDIPIDQLKRLNQLWRDSIKKYHSGYLLECLKSDPPDFDQYLLACEDFKELHPQFRWEKMDWQDRLKEKLPHRYKKRENTYEQYFFD